MDEIVYCRATEANVQLLIDFRVEFLLGYSGLQTAETIAALRTELEDYFGYALAQNAYICWYAKVGDKIAGIGGMVVVQSPGNFKNPSGRRGHIMNMYTVPGYRNKGICTTILNKLQETAEEKLGITFFELHATKQGEPVYVKNGFKMHGEPTYRKYSGSE